MMEFVNGKDDIPYMMENNPNVWNQQPAIKHIIANPRYPAQNQTANVVKTMS